MFKTGRRVSADHMSVKLILLVAISRLIIKASSTTAIRAYSKRSLLTQIPVVIQYRTYVQNAVSRDRRKLLKPTLTTFLAYTEHF